MGPRDLLYPGGRHYLSLSVRTNRQNWFKNIIIVEYETAKTGSN